MHEVNSAHAKIRAVRSRAIASLKTWSVLAKMHRSQARSSGDFVVARRDQRRAAPRMIRAPEAGGGWPSSLPDGGLPGRRLAHGWRRTGHLPEVAAPVVVEAGVFAAVDPDLVLEDD